MLSMPDIHFLVIDVGHGFRIFRGPYKADSHMNHITSFVFCELFKRGKSIAIRSQRVCFDNPLKKKEIFIILHLSYILHVFRVKCMETLILKPFHHGSKSYETINNDLNLQTNKKIFRLICVVNC